MNSDQINAEQQAAESLVRLLEVARECERLHVRARMSLPEPLKRLMGMNGVSPTVSGPPVISAPAPPPMPAEAQSGWLYIPQASCTPTTIVLAVLRAAGEALAVKDVIAKVTAILPNVPGGTINNIGTRLTEAGDISRGADGWLLEKLGSAGILRDGYVWGPSEVFRQGEVAFHRRMAIVHVLNNFESGLQIRQLGEQLSRCSWVHAPVNKDLLKADMEILSSEGKVRRRGNSKKWEALREQS